MRALRLPAAVLALVLAAAPTACGGGEVAQVPPQPSRPNKVVMGYYRTSNRAVLDHAGIEYQYLTHIAHAFAWPDASGNLVVPAGYLYPELNAAARANGVKMIAGLGGWGNCAGFPGMASTAANRARFIGQLVDFCRAKAYDGVDIDWEFVSNETEKADFVLFIEALGAAFKAQSPPLLLTAAVPSDQLLRALDRLRAAGRRLRLHRFHDLRLSRHLVRSLRPQLAAVHAARGRCAARSTAPSPTAAAARSLWPSCSWAWPSSAGPSTAAPWASRSRRAGAGTTARSWPSARRSGPASGTAKPRSRYMRRTDGGMLISYDDMSSIGLKCQYVKDKASAGVIIWELGSDRRSGNSELLEVVGRSFGARPAAK